MDCSPLDDGAPPGFVPPGERSLPSYTLGTRKQTMTIQGFCEPRFQAVREEFDRNFQERGEVGASVCVTVEGETVVDLWGGLADRTAGKLWERDTIGLVWSCTKGATALCAHMLCSRGLLDVDEPVARYWPEFAQAGKEAIPIRLLLD